MTLKNVKPGRKFILVSTLNEPDAIAVVYEKMAPSREVFPNPDRKHDHCELRLGDRSAQFIPENTKVIVLDLKT